MITVRFFSIGRTGAFHLAFGMKITGLVHVSPGTGLHGLFHAHGIFNTAPLGRQRPAPGDFLLHSSMLAPPANDERQPFAAAAIGKPPPTTRTAGIRPH
ncbi:hypothetical protein [Nonomuraea sp. NPDC048826]|uniref:hypothetical protein n=1 Tax=Nonomuraea sp. NPDC048826 TaxID=3364347 RepID=UPI003710682C